MKRMNWSWIAPLALAAALLPALVFAGQALYPNKFVNGEVADADQVNANFAALAVAINDNDDRVSGLEERGAARATLVKVVSLVDEALNGQALIAAIAALPPDVSLDTPFKIQLEAGSYDVGDTPLVLPGGVALCGVDPDSSVIRSSAQTALSIGPVVLRDFRLEHEPTADESIAVLCTNSPPNDFFRPSFRSVHVDVATVASSTGIDLRGAVSARLVGVEVTVRGHLTTGAVTGLSASWLDNRIPSFLADACWFRVFNGETSVGLDLDVARAIMTGSNVVGADTALRHGGSLECRFRNCVFSGEVNAIDGSLRTNVACSEIDGAILGEVQTVHCYDSSFEALP